MDGIFPFQLPGLERVKLVITHVVAVRNKLPYKILEEIFGGDERLQQFNGKDVGPYHARIHLFYGSEEAEICDIEERIFGHTPEQERKFRTNIRQLADERRMKLRALYCHTPLQGEVTEIVIPVLQILAGRRLSKGQNEKSPKGSFAIKKKGGNEYLHYGEDGTLLFVRMPTPGESDGLALLLSKYVVNTIIASYALALVGPHRKWVEALRRRAP